MKMKKPLIAMLAIVLTGCATKVVPPNLAKSAPSERVYKYQLYDGKKSAITVIRDSGFGGAGCFSSVYIDGDVVAKLDPGEKATFYVNSGDRAVGAALEGRGLCGLNGQRQERYINVTHDEHKYLRVFISASGDIDIRPTTLK